MKKFIIIINGPSGVGKSTVSHILSRDFRKCAHVDVNLLRHFDPNHRITPQHIGLAYRNAADVAANFVEAGWRAIIDGVFPSIRDVRRFLAFLRDKSIPVYLYNLSGKFKVIRERAKQRGKRTGQEQMKALYTKMEPQVRAHGIFIDTTEMGAAATVEKVKKLFQKGEGLIAGGEDT